MKRIKHPVCDDAWQARDESEGVSQLQVAEDVDAHGHGLQQQASTTAVERTGASCLERARKLGLSFGAS